MKKILYPLLAVTAVCGILGSCNSGVYQANPASNANGSVNPLTPLTSSQFTWSGTDPMSADINGTHWVADTATFFFNDTSGYNVLVGSKGSDSNATEIALLMQDVWTNNLYNMGYKTYNRNAMWVDKGGNPWGYITLPSAIADHYYYSYLGNSGEVKIIQNDTANIKGLFYFQGVTSSGKVVTVSNGYFHILKQH